MGLKQRERPADVEAKYDVALKFPNLELHSAAASGNVGLVHYALTHGQPVNSVLHGVLPLHAACSGGSVSVVRMLIERGADVNAPRLPRRYSDGKKSTAPSVGAAGSTPLHFAAANGHADIVQILLTCGAKANKADKNGMTPEALAEINGHTDVIRVLRVWQHLMASDGKDTASIAPSLYTVNGAQDQSPPDSTFDDAASIQGKSRSASFVSQRSTSTTGSVVRLKHSLESLGFRKNAKSSRSASMVSTATGDGPRPTPLINGNDGSDDPPSPIDSSLATSSPHTVEFDRLDRTHSHSSGTSLLPSSEQQSIHDLEFSPPPSAGLGPTPSRNNPSTTGSSRRPSLPSILEKPGAAFRAALRREHHRPPPLDTSAISTSPTSESPMSSLSPQVSPALSTHSRGLFRGRQNSGDESKQHHARKYMSKHTLTHLFKRGQSPPSRSPSPPDRSTPTQPIDPEQLQEGIERLKRASLDLEREQSVYGSAEDLTEPHPPLPPQPRSAPAVKTSFFHEELDQSDPINSTPLPSSSTLPQLSSRADRDLPNNAIRRRPRKTSEVISPSPLAQEWANSSDSDTPPTMGIRRAKTEVVKSSLHSDFAAMVNLASFPRPALQADRSQPPSPLRPSILNPRNASSTSLASSARSVSGGRLVGAGRADSSELRRAASIKSVSRQLEESSRTSMDSERASSELADEKAEEPVVEQVENKEKEDDGAETETDDAERKARIDLTELENDVFHDAADGLTDRPFEAEDEEKKQGEKQLGRQEEKEGEEEREDDDDEAVKTTPNAAELSQPIMPSIEVDSPIQAEAEQEEHISSRSSEVGNGARTPVEQEALVYYHGRYRGASIGSATTESSRISTTPSLRMSQITTDDEPRTPTSGQFDGSFFPISINLSHHTRTRGKSISSISSNRSDLAYSYNMPSSPATSLTPPSTISVNLGRFPPVPEHAVAPAHQRRVSNRAEAREMKKQAEEGIMQLAQLPATLDSSRDLAAQLAAYGDGHALEREFAEQERLAGRDEVTEESESDARSEDEYFSAQSDAASRLSTNGSDYSHPGAGPSRRRVTPPSNLRHAALPSAKSGQTRKSIEMVYAKREAAYRERMAALTALPPSFPSSFSSSYRGSGGPLSSTAQSSWLLAGSHHQPQHHRHHHHHRSQHPAQRVPSQHYEQTDSAEPEVDRHPDISGPFPVHSAEGMHAARQVSGGGKRAAAAAHSIRHAASKASSLAGNGPLPALPAGLSASAAMSTRTISGSSRSARHQQSAAAPIADVVKTRYAGMSPPSNVPQPPRLESSSPYISVFSNRYAGQPLDGDDSDDELHPDQRLTVVENNWSGRAMGSGDDFKKGRWGQLKGAIGHLGHRK